METRMNLRTGVVMAIMILLSVTINAANGNNQNRVNQSAVNLRCINQLPDLTDDQITKITALERSHQEQMTELRNERRLSTDINAKEVIWTKMMTQCDSHRSDVNKLLTPEQQKVYAQIQQTPNQKYQKSQPRGNRGRGNGNARSSRCGYGGGNRSGNGCRR